MKTIKLKCKPNGDKPFVAEVLGAGKGCTGLMLNWLDKTKLDVAGTEWEVTLPHEGIYWVQSLYPVVRYNYKYGAYHVPLLKRYYILLVNDEEIIYRAWDKTGDIMRNLGVDYTTAIETIYDDLLTRWKYFKALRESQKAADLDYSEIDPENI